MKGRPRDTSAALLKLQAKQNVIFEMRFLFSRLGRERVCVVYESGVELPSDLSGILYVQYDSGKGWMYAVAEEMKAAGYEVDLNAVVTDVFARLNGAFSAIAGKAGE